MMYACSICGRVSDTRRCGAHPYERSPSSKATSKASHKARRTALLENAEMVCGLCNQPIAEGEVFDTHHVTPVSLGGEHGELAVTHASCNRSTQAR